MFTYHYRIWTEENVVIRKLKGLYKLWKQSFKQPKPFLFFWRSLLYRIGFSHKCIFWYEGACFHAFPTSVTLRIWLYPHDHDFHCTKDISFLRKILRKGDTFVDVGANIGTHAITLAQHVGSQGIVVAIEAHPRTFQYLVANIELNQLHNIVALHAAVGHESGEIRITDRVADDQNFVVASFSESAPDKNTYVCVPVSRLDDIALPSFITVLKIDVEGYEKFVLEGAINTIKRSQMLYLEISEQNFELYGYNTKDISQFLRTLGMRVLRFLDEKCLVLMEPDYQTPYRFENIVAVWDMDWLSERLRDSDIKIQV